MRKFLSAVLVLGAAVAVVGWFGYRWAQGPESGRGESVRVSIAQGASATQIAETLEQSRVVDSALAFRMYLRLNDINADLKAGDYELEASQPFDDLVAELVKGPQADFVRMTIPEGLNVDQTAARVAEQTHITAEDFLEAADPARIRPALLPADATTLEGFLYPSTYFVEESETAETLVRRMVDTFEEETREVGLDSGVAGLTPYQVVILASLIEEEAKASEERDEISAVIHNRLERNIALGIDATIQYAVGKYAGEPLTVSDLNIDSPFNSRTHAGLPPHPISSPRASSVEAALNPAPVDYLYYVLSPDCVHHVFTADYNEFLAAKNNQPRNC